MAFANCWTDAFGLAESVHKARVMKHTWGHLAPKPRTSYNGTIIFTQGEYGDFVVIKSKFDKLDDSPWFFDHMQDFICTKAKNPGTVYKFTGTYMMFKNGNGRFSGKVRAIKIQ